MAAAASEGSSTVAMTVTEPLDTSGVMYTSDIYVVGTHSSHTVSLLRTAHCSEAVLKGSGTHKERAVKGSARRKERQ